MNIKLKKFFSSCLVFLSQDKCVRIFLIGCAILTTIPVFLMFYFIFGQAWPIFQKIGLKGFVESSLWKPTDIPAQFGVFFMIAGSLFVTLVAMFLAMIIGLLTSIYIVFFCKKRLAEIINQAVSLLASIPSVVYGFWGLMIVVPAVRAIFGGNGSCVLSAGIVLSLIVLPTVISLCTSALKTVPHQYLAGALALGSEPEEAILFVVLRAAKPGILHAFILAFGRAIGETTAVVLVAGNANIFPGLLKPVRTLTANIVLEMGYASGFHYNAIIASGAVLLLIVLILNMVARRIRAYHQG